MTETRNKGVESALSLGADISTRMYHQFVITTCGTASPVGCVPCNLLCVCHVPFHLPFGGLGILCVSLILHLLAD